MCLNVENNICSFYMSKKVPTQFIVKNKEHLVFGCVGNKIPQPLTVLKIFITEEVLF